MGVDLVGIAEEIVEAVFIGRADVVALAEAPLAAEGGGVAGVVEEIGEGDVLGGEGDALPRMRACPP